MANSNAPDASLAALGLTTGPVGAGGSDAVQRVSNLLGKMLAVVDWSAARFSGSCYDYKTRQQKTRPQINAETGKPTGKNEYVPLNVLLVNVSTGGKTKMPIGQMPAGIVGQVNLTIGWGDVPPAVRPIVARNTLAHAEVLANKGKAGKAPGQLVDLAAVAAGSTAGDDDA